MRMSLGCISDLAGISGLASQALMMRTLPDVTTKTSLTGVQIESLPVLSLFCSV